MTRTRYKVLYRVQRICLAVALFITCSSVHVSAQSASSWSDAKNPSTARGTNPKQSSAKPPLQNSGIPSKGTQYASQPASGSTSKPSRSDQQTPNGGQNSTKLSHPDLSPGGTDKLPSQGDRPHDQNSSAPGPPLPLAELALLVGIAVGLLSIRDRWLKHPPGHRWLWANQIVKHSKLKWLRRVKLLLAPIWQEKAQSALWQALLSSKTTSYQKLSEIRAYAGSESIQNVQAFGEAMEKAWIMHSSVVASDSWQADLFQEFQREFAVPTLMESRELFQSVPIHIRIHAFLEAACRVMGAPAVCKKLNLPSIYDIGIAFDGSLGSPAIGLVDDLEGLQNKLGLQNWLLGEVESETNQIVITASNPVIVALRSDLEARLLHIRSDVRQNLIAELDRREDQFKLQDQVASTRAVDEIVEYTNTHFTSDEIDLFVVNHMRSNQMRNAFASRKSFADEKASPESHLSVASGFIGEMLASMLWRGRAPNRPFRVIEGGPGFLATTYNVLTQLKLEINRHAVDPVNRRHGKPHVQYVGFDLSNEYRMVGNLYFQHRNAITDRRFIDAVTALEPPRNVEGPNVVASDVDSWPSEAMEHERRTEMQRLLEDVWISKVDISESRVGTDSWQKEREYIYQCSMQAGVKELIKANPEDSFDAFICTYAFHHVANPNAVKRLLFGKPRIGEDRDLLAFSSQIRLDALEWLANHISQNRLHLGLVEEKSESFWPVAKSILSYLPRCLTSWEQEAIVNLFRCCSSFDTAQPESELHSSLPVNASRALGLFRNDQFSLLRDVYRLLRVGGVVAIADPDGHSMYNRQELFSGPRRDPEAACAYFLRKEELINLLITVGFHIEYVGQQTAYRLPGSPKTLYSIGSPAGVSISTLPYYDDNRGYMVIACK